MRKLNHLDKYRIVHPLAGNMGDEFNGAFDIPYRGEEYRVLASNGGGWEHISISRQSKHPPVWETMCHFKDLFFYENEVVMQLHPAKENYINNHQNCLHLWRPISGAVKVKCPKCKGAGYTIEGDRNNEPEQNPCPYCEASGVYDAEPANGQLIPLPPPEFVGVKIGRKIGEILTTAMVLQESLNQKPVATPMPTGGQRITEEKD